MLSIKNKKIQEYKNIGNVYCPYFKENITFNSKGINHIFFKKYKKARSLNDQYTRLKFINFAPIIINKSHTLQEFRYEDKIERVKKNQIWTKEKVSIKYFGFIAIIKNIKLKIIIKKVNNGRLFFWSLIPFWKTKSKEGKIKKVFYDGNLEIQ